MIRDDTRTRDVHEPHVLRPASRPAGTGDENVVDLLKQLAGQGSHLAEQQLALIKAEIRESTGELKTAVGAMAGAAIVGLAGLGVTLLGIGFLLGQAIHNVALGTLIVGIVSLVLAYIMYRTAAGKMSAANLSPDRTERTLQRTPDALRGDLNPENQR